MAEQLPSLHEALDTIPAKVWAAEVVQCSQRTQLPALLGQLTTTCNSSTKKSDTLF